MVLRWILAIHTYTVREPWFSRITLAMHHHNNIHPATFFKSRKIQSPRHSLVLLCFASMSKKPLPLYVGCGGKTKTCLLSAKKPVACQDLRTAVRSPKSVFCTHIQAHQTTTRKKSNVFFGFRCLAARCLGGEPAMWPFRRVSSWA